MAPVSVRMGLNEKVSGLTVRPKVQMVDRKYNVDPLRFEQRTPGYTLLNFNAGCQWRRLRLEARGNNLLNSWTGGEFASRCDRV